MRYLPGLIPKEFKVLPDYFKGSLYRSSKNNGFISFLGWFFGVFFLIGAFIQLYHPLLSFFYCLLGILSLPPGHRWIEKTFRFRFRTRIKTFFIVLVIVCAAPFVWHYANVDKKEFEVAQAKAAQEERDKEAAAQREKSRKDSLEYFILASVRQREQHKPDEAEKQLQHASGFALTPEDKQRLEQENNTILQLRLEDLVAAGQYSSALPQLNELIIHEPNNADLLYIRAMCYSHTGDIANAVQDCNAAAALGNQKAAQLNDKINPVVKHITGYVTECCDGTISYATGRGACSHHGGVCNWNSPVYEESRKYQ